MPELPEVEVVRRGLEQILEKKPVLKKIELKRKDLRGPIPIQELEVLLGQPVTAIERRAKYLILWTPKGGMLSHLGMTGTWRVAAPGDEKLHDHIYLHFSDNLRLAYRDPRRFGSFDFLPLSGEHPKLDHLGAEPLSREFTGASLWQRLRGKKVSLKVAVMDQKLVVGVGNIYASEALFAAFIKPQMAAEKLSLEKAKLLVSEIKKILKLSIRRGGSTISDYSQASGESGYFQNSFQVYGRDGEPCSRCKSKIKSEVLGGRNTFWCPRCQK